MIRVVLDTNVFVSAFLVPGRLNQIAELAIQKSFIWLISDQILEEYAAVGSRPLHHLSAPELGTLLYQVKERAEWIEVKSSFSVIHADPSDNKFLECAVDGRAHSIITGDRHLLRLKEFHGISIRLPAEFLKNLK